MENVDKIQKLLNNAGAIEKLFTTTIQKWQDDRDWDKTGAQFNIDERFKACQGFPIWFSSWEGVYGNSSCSTVLQMDADLFKEHMVKVLNNNKKLLMMQVAQSMKEEGVKYQEQARKELQEKLNQINSI